MIGQSYGEAANWMDSTEEEIAVWTSMIENPNHWIDTRLPIRTNLTPRSEWLTHLIYQQIHVEVMVGLKGLWAHRQI